MNGNKCNCKIHHFVKSSRGVKRLESIPWQKTAETDRDICSSYLFSGGHLSNEEVSALLSHDKVSGLNPITKT